MYLRPLLLQLYRTNRGPGLLMSTGVVYTHRACPHWDKITVHWCVPCTECCKPVKTDHPATALEFCPQYTRVIRGLNICGKKRTILHYSYCHLTTNTPPSWGHRATWQLPTRWLLVIATYSSGLLIYTHTHLHVYIKSLTCRYVTMRWLIYKQH